MCLKNDPSIKINFIDTQLIETSKINDINYPDCKIGGKIIHKIFSEDLYLLNKFTTGDEVIITINTDRRNLLTQSHSVTHVMYMAIDLLKSDIVTHILGCHIKWSP